MTSKRGPSAGSVMANWAWRPRREDLLALTRGGRKRSIPFGPDEVKKLLSRMTPEERVQFLSQLSS